MRKFALAASLIILAPSPSVAEERSVNLSVPGMFCASCPFVVQAAIGEVDGVLSVTTDVDERTALVLYEDAVATIDVLRLLGCRGPGAAAAACLLFASATVTRFFERLHALPSGPSWPSSDRRPVDDLPPLFT